MRRVLCPVVLLALIVTALDGPRTYAIAGEDTTTSRPAVPLCAVLVDRHLGLQESPLIALFETQLISDGQLRLVERSEIKKILQEQALQLAFTPAGAGQRRELGRLLKADLLVLLRAAQEKEGDRFIEAAVCETGAGLRFGAGRLPWSADTQKTLEELSAATGRAFLKYRQGVREICAVPPFVARDFAHELDYLQTAYARLVEQMLLERPGFAVVELAEARAIEEELKLAGDGLGIVRKPPVYVLGEYQSRRTDGHWTVTVTMSLKRAETPLGSQTRADLPAEGAAAALRDAVGQLLAVQSSTTQAANGSREAEVRELNERATMLSSLGMNSEALELIEASLLLDPDQGRLHYEATVVIRRLLSSLNGHMLAPEADQQFVRTAAACRPLLLHHWEQALLLYQTGEDRDSYASFTYGIRAAAEIGWSTRLSQERAERRRRELNEQMHAAAVRVLEASVRRGRLDRAVKDNLMPVLVPGPGGYDERLRVMRIACRLPGAEQLLIDIANSQTSDRDNREEYESFLKEMANLPHPKAASLADFVRRPKRPATVPASLPTSRPAQVLVQSRPAEDVDISFEPLSLKLDELPGGVVRPGYLRQWVPCKGGVDAVLVAGQLCLMREPGRLESVCDLKKYGGSSGDMVYDGRYLWTYGRSDEPTVLAFDMQTSRVETIDAVKGGLPPATNGIAAAAVGPGRICLAGSFGRTKGSDAFDRGWIGLAGIGATGGITVEIIKRAGLQYDLQAGHRDDLSADLAFAPEFMVPLGDCQDGSAPYVLIKRRTFAGAGAFPLVIDVQHQDVRVLPVPLKLFREELPATQYDGRLYWVGPVVGDGSGRPLTSVGPPDFVEKPMALLRCHPEILTTYRDCFIMVGDPRSGPTWFIANMDGQDIRSARVHSGTMWQEPRRLFHSHHYGLVFQNPSGVVKVKFRPGLFPGSGEGSKKEQ